MRKKARLDGDTWRRGFLEIPCTMINSRESTALESKRKHLRLTQGSQFYLLQRNTMSHSSLTLFASERKLGRLEETHALYLWPLVKKLSKIEQVYYA